MKTTDLKILKSEYSLVKNNWKDIYQWKRIASKGNTEVISKMLSNDFKTIKWSDNGLRTKNFKIKNHKGLCQIQTSIKQFTEKRFCRALFNEFNTMAHPLLGRMLDYETPLTEQNQKQNKTNQGDIDLVAKRKQNILLIEAKKAKSTESVLKALLEIFVYTLRLEKFKRIEQFKDDFNQKSIKKIVPCILMFKDSTSGKQILNIKNYPTFLELLNIINKELCSNNIAPVEFYIIEQPCKDYKNFLNSKSVLGNNKEKKISFNGKLLIYQYSPSLCGNNKNFENSIEKCSDVYHISMLFRSYLTYYKADSIKYISIKINRIQDLIENYNSIFPKNTAKAENLQKLINRMIIYVDAYLQIASDYIFSEFHNLNLRLVNQYRIQKLVPPISQVGDNNSLVKLIELYNNLRIVKRKDYDGVFAQEIDQNDEKVIIDALCKFYNPKLIPVLEKSLLQGVHNKKKVINKLMDYRRKDEIYKLVEEYAETENIFISALTNKKENAKRVIKILNEL